MTEYICKSSFTSYHGEFCACRNVLTRELFCNKMQGRRICCYIYMHLIWGTSVLQNKWRFRQGLGIGVDGRIQKAWLIATNLHIFMPTTLEGSPADSRLGPAHKNLYHSRNQNVFCLYLTSVHPSKAGQLKNNIGWETFCAISSLRLKKWPLSFSSGRVFPDSVPSRQCPRVSSKSLITLSEGTY